MAGMEANVMSDFLNLIQGQNGHTRKGIAWALTYMLSQGRALPGYGWVEKIFLGPKYGLMGKAANLS